MKLKSIALPEMVGKTLQDVSNYLEKTYTLPTGNVINEICNGDTDIPKDGNYYFNFGLLVRSSVGNWLVPCACWGGSSWVRTVDWPDSNWGPLDRALILDDTTTKPTLSSGLRGNIDTCELTDEDREKGVDVKDLIA